MYCNLCNILSINTVFFFRVHFSIQDLLKLFEDNFFLRTAYYSNKRFAVCLLTSYYTTTH